MSETGFEARTDLLSENANGMFSGEHECFGKEGGSVRAGKLTRSLHRGRD